MDWARGLDDEQWAEALTNDKRAPPMPPEALQAMYVGSSGVAAFKEAATFWNLTKAEMAKQGMPIGGESRVLDIGVGWGRLYRWALRDIDAKSITGIDVDQSAISLCSDAMPFGDFKHVAPGMAYPVEKGYYDLGYLYSVFSHLSEGTARSVLAAARKALKPGGLLALTTLRLAHVDVWNDQFVAKTLPECGFDRVDWWERAAEGHHLYVPTGGGHESRPSDAYGEAIAPKGWWENVEGYKLLNYARHSGLPQSYVVLQNI